MKRLMTTTSTVAAAAALTALLAGCNLAPRYQTPQGADCSHCRAWACCSAASLATTGAAVAVTESGTAPCGVW